MNTKYLWLAVEADEYELPLAVADTARELGEIVGNTTHNIMVNASRGSSGRISGIKYVKVVDE